MNPVEINISCAPRGSFARLTGEPPELGGLS